MNQCRAAVIPFDKFRIRPVKNQQGLGWQVFGQSFNLGQTDHGAGRVVRIGDEDQLRLVGAGTKDRVHVGDAFVLWHFDRGCPGGQRTDLVKRKPVFGVNDLIPRPGIGLAEECDDLVRSDSADDLVGVQVIHLCNRCAQGGVVGRGISVQFMYRATHRLLCSGAGAKRVFVRAELDHIRHAIDM